MHIVVWFLLLPGLLLGQPVAQADGCSDVFADARQFTAGVYDEALVDVEDGVIVWDSTGWDNIVRRVVGTSEFYLNNCLDPDQPLSAQLAAVEQLAAMSRIAPPVETVNVGGDFGEVTLSSDFTPATEFLDLNGDGVDELILHTQVPYFSQDTVYQLRGGLSIAFFQTEGDGWQGQVIAPVTGFVTDETGPHDSYAMTDDNTLSVEESNQALAILPGPGVEVISVDDAPLTAITLLSTTGTGEAKELDMLTWDGRMPEVKLRVSFNDWCYPGQELAWEIREDGSVFVPSNGGEEGSPLHCGRTPAVLFQWDAGQYVAVAQ